ncbi:MAG: HAMP domain-containing sensor histidine kinase [Candidatus Carbobacillus sp.]|nr:HAMP domain-containing sensor histidine kinase [Candidatus Carbobacillus sp.]
MNHAHERSAQSRLKHFMNRLLLRPRTLSRRFTVWLFLTMLVLLILYSVVQYVVLMRWLMRDEIEKTKEMLAQIETYMASEFSRPSWDMAKIQEGINARLPEDDTLEVRDPSGKILWMIGKQREFDQMVEHSSGTTGESQEGSSNDVGDKTEWEGWFDREHVLKLQSTVRSSLQTYQLTLIHPLTRMDEWIQTFVNVLMLGLIAALFISIVLAMFLSQWMLRPIRALIRTFQKIQNKDLSARAPLSSTEDELNQLSRTFNQMMDRVEASFVKQKQFTADAAHELRTPLAAISGHVRLLRRWGKDDPEQLIQSLEAIDEETARLTHLVEQLLTLSRLELDDRASIWNGLNGDLEERCNIHDAYETGARLLVDFRTMYPSFKFTYDIRNGKHNHPSAIDESYLARRIALPCALLRQLFMIILDNAVKYSAEQEKVHFIGETMDQGLVFYIIDHGLGIPDHEKPRVFDRFYRVDTARRRGGSGIGLSIAKMLVDHAGGRIELANTDGCGTTVKIVLPFISD